VATTLPYTLRCPMCEYTDTWVVITSEGANEGALPLRAKLTFVEELAAEHPNHPKPRNLPGAS
jgi:hypothetical protein